ncbi:tRNA (uridine(54)-C5)-methyltransferase TrmA [Celerinatantimonas diazotrophica]|uniref:tRNA/tmRNA (uracil-C(5))-methyltransferase n=1 Tax=Celerinatantimonas diazotrophica TaxID=412034 RepID=A0A4R1K6D1_9GAMM|nr:tRNA (uridine(54)-C5)-methyltransferase TrmA [Celerinatantimonas diazotrophica]TCK59786.1 tRNA (uracil-5-)-methyltransferase [Celerinatantimonas diazotrophica]CAG9295531.1 tRNA/tmRNA (uracil-C(5))-methyltransferase [Celerinatantimonas diazotrophica]
MADIAYYPEQYQSLLEQKVARIQARFECITQMKPQIFASQPSHYRMRAEFRVWHDGDDLYYIMFDPQTKQKIRIDQFGPASELINQVMVELVERLKGNQMLRHKLFQVDFLSTQSDQIVVSLLYHKKLDSAWQNEAVQLRDTLREQFNLHLIGRARKQKILLDQDFVVETLNVNQRPIHYKQVENSFTQPNAGINEKMLGWALDVTEKQSGDLLELYCGNGNFSLALAENFKRVLATEIAKPSVDSAQFNIRVNQIENVKILRMSAEEFTEAMQGRTFRRLAQANVSLDDYQCDTIFVDPPRAGLDDATLAMVNSYANILYISCNPATLLENLQTLTKTHQLSQWAIFDQFPYTEHAEVGVWLNAK